MSDDFDVLHAAALRKRTDLAGIERSTGLPAEGAEPALARAVEAKRAVAARGTWLVTPAGDEWLRAEYATRYAALRADRELAEAYERFEVVNRDVKAIVTQWQTRMVAGQPVANDHSDEEWDARVLGRLSDAHEIAEPVIAAFARKLPRMIRYGDRLAEALERAEAGETDFVSGVRCDSYHTVWFELHEDLLRILGRAREE